MKMKGLKDSCLLVLFLAMSAYAFPNTISNKIPEGLSNTLQRKSVDLLKKIVQTKIDFGKNRGIHQRQINGYYSPWVEKEFRRQELCGKDLVKSLKTMQHLFDETQGMQLRESHVTRNLKHPNEKVYLKDFRHIEFKLRELVSKLRKLSKAFGYKASEMPAYSVGLGPKSISAKKEKSFSKAEINIINFKQLENIEKCLECFRKRRFF